MPEATVDIGEKKSLAQLPEVIRQIRKPEARSAYSDILANTMRNYLGEIFDQPTPPITVLELKKRRGLILFEGSILRGTATEKTGDFDFFLLSDDRQIDENTLGELSIFTRDIEKYHPQKETFPEYLMKKLKSNPELQRLYDARIAEMQRIKDSRDKLVGNKPGPANLASHYFIHADPQFESLLTILKDVEAGENAKLWENETPTRAIVVLLATTPDMVFEATPGALTYHQKQVVASLQKLQGADPTKFNSFYKLLEKDFANLHRSTAWRYPDRDFRLLAEYYLRSDKFVPQDIQRQQLVDLTTRRLTYEAIRDDIKYWQTIDDSKANPELPLKL